VRGVDLPAEGSPRRQAGRDGERPASSPRSDNTRLPDARRGESRHRKWAGPRYDRDRASDLRPMLLREGREGSPIDGR
jgi:hypothetical protein